MPQPRVPRLSRRGLFAAGGALALGALATACGGRGSSNDTSDGNTKGWSFTDDRGTTVTAASKPKNIVAFVGTAAVLHDYGIECVGVFGPTKDKNGNADVQAGDLDVNKLTVLGNTWGEFNIEKYVSLQPDLLVSSMYVKDTLWYVPDQSKDKIFEVAPSVGINVANVSLPVPIQRHEELAKALGADLTAQRVVDAKARFEQAVELLRDTVKAKGGIKVMAASGSADLFYVSTPDPSADLRYFRELGVDFVIPDKLDSGGFYESLSWENADKYQADLIMLDNRSTAMQPQELQAKPTWNRLPAVAAGQVIPWVTEPRFSYAGCAPVIEQLAGAIQNAKKLG